ncbi:hypothetical protein HE1_00253 [Holospora elegans E1]|uniref:Uncharacterized protein n=1 Tax=Holospora elegans E1 TaxID=1427503 RepID=A0A023DYC6_9PROT|nr:hypothetical protein HE1_00253 [Holospora elegans E1]
MSRKSINFCIIKKRSKKFGFLKLGFQSLGCAGKQLIDWEFGDHSGQTFKRLFERLKKWKILFYCGNHWAGFNKIIPSPPLFQGKDKTLSIEQNNAPHRHWFARFRPPCKHTIT